MTEYLIYIGAVDKEILSHHTFLFSVLILSHMIRKDNPIKGILIQNKEYKLSQYADDTQIFLGGSELSLRKTLAKLKSFHSFSGLRINVEKTRKICIGSMNKSDRKMCEDYKLDWNQGPFKILGVTSTPGVFVIWDQNTIDILKKVENTIKTWSKRRLSLQGKITFIKSLAIAKFVHPL